jgi:tetratricopeptide (TPR) repeat protein
MIDGPYLWNVTLNSVKFFILLLFSITALCGCQSLEQREQRANLILQSGVALYDAGRYPEALRELQRAYKENPRSPVIANALGLAYQARGRADLAIKYMLEAISLAPDYTEARNNLVRMYIDTKEYSKAQQQLSLVKKDLTYAALDKVYINEGLLYFDQKKYEDALDPFEKAINYSRENCSAHHFYGKSLFELKRYAEAATALDRAIIFCQKTGSDEPHYLSALAHYRAGDKRKAAARFEEITKLYPNGEYYEKSKSLLEIVKKEL